MTHSTFAIYQRHDGCPTTVLYSHLTEKEADDECDRLNSALNARGIPACVWNEPHHPSTVFVIGKRINPQPDWL